MSLVLRGLAKRYPQLDLELSLEIPSGDLATLLGPSGCGKTTALRLIAGLLPGDRGEVILDGRDVSGLAPFTFGIPLMSRSKPARRARCGVASHSAPKRSVYPLP